MKKLFTVGLMTLALAACGQAATENAATENAPTETTDTAAVTEENDAEEAVTVDLGPIAVIMREEGSGSRDAFEDILGVNQEDDESDAVTALAVIGQGNGGVATAVAENDSAIGFVSFATLGNDRLHGLSIDGAAPTHENVLNGSFPMARPFMAVYNEEGLSEIGQAFIAFARSLEGAEELEAAGTIPDAATAEAFDIDAFSHLSGTLTLGGSTSVERAAIALGDMFSALLPNITVTYDSAGSGAGIRGAQDGTYEIGFASRDIRDGELEAGNNSFLLTMDGLAIVVNTANPIENVTLEELRSIYLGEIASWTELN
ncbi:MAG: substrate-binding domain-containing protein [Turicibacter sp.]|nr:substrate-binding domain-containing protein [Turicibacter sp.]